MTDTSDNILSANNVSKRYMARGTIIDALRSINLEIGQKEAVGIIGPSGCGKSTLLLILAGLEMPTSGEIQFNGETLNKPRREIALVLQEYGLFPWKTVGENIELGLRIRKEKVNPGKISEILSELRIPEKIDIYPQQLSGGQKQRVALARAIILNPNVLLLDEPFAALDTIERERLQDLTAELLRHRQLCMVLVSHNIPEVVRLCKTIIVMKSKPGEIIAAINNPGGGTNLYRETEEYHQKTLEIRKTLESISA